MRKFGNVRKDLIVEKFFHGNMKAVADFLQCGNGRGSVPVKHGIDGRQWNVGIFGKPVVVPVVVSA